MPIDPEIGFTSGVIRDPNRFVGRTELIRDCIKALNTRTGVIAVYGKRGVGKSSLLRQLQHMALGDYTLARGAGLYDHVPERSISHLTVYYSCDSMINNGEDLLRRLCNDQDPQDGLLRLLPADGKELVEFSRSKGIEFGIDLKVVKWGREGIESSKYGRPVPGDIVQTFRNYVSAIVQHQVIGRMNRGGLLIILDEFDVIKDKSGIGSLIKSLTSEQVKFAICGIGRDLSELVADHLSLERLLEEGILHVTPMPFTESRQIILTAEKLFADAISFNENVKKQIAELSQGYPYFTQLIGKECVSRANELSTPVITEEVFNLVLQDIKLGKAFPTLEQAYQRAIGNSEDRQHLLYLLAEQPDEVSEYTTDIGRIILRKVRKDAEDFDIPYVDQLIPRLVDENYGPVLMRIPDRAGLYEFVNPIFRLYVRLRKL